MSALIHNSCLPRWARPALLPAVVMALAVAPPALGQSAPPPPPADARPPRAPSQGAPPAQPSGPVLAGPGAVLPAPPRIASRSDAARQRALAAENDPARRTLLESKFFVDDEEWAKAAERLREFASRYPNDRKIDEALYYHAYALKKLGRYDDSWRSLERLTSQFAKSRWLDDAKALQLEIAPMIGKQEFVDAEARRKADDELKVIALQSLMSSNPDRAVQLIRDILKSGSTSSPEVKQRALMLLGQAGPEKGKPILLDVVRSESDPEMRRYAVLSLGMFLDDGDGFDAETFNVLREIVRTSTDEEFARTALMALSHGDNPQVCQLLTDMATTSTASSDLRRHAVLLLGERDGCSSYETLEKIYSSSTDEDLRRFALMSLTNSDAPKAVDFMVRVAQSDPSVEMRRFALLQLSQRDPGRAVLVIAQIYDAERNETLKEQMIMSLGQIEDRRALEKLIKIAKEDPSMEMRRKAVFWIGQSNDPDAAKFLEEILR